MGPCQGPVQAAIIISAEFLCYHFPMNNDEKLENDQKKKIINRLISQLSVDFYYTPTTEVASVIHEKIQEGDLPRQDYELVKNLSSRDIEVLISFASSCC